MIGLVWPTLQQKMDQTHFLHVWPQKPIKSLQMVHALMYQVSWPVPIFIMFGQFLALWGPQTFWRGIATEFHASGKFLSICFETWTWNLVYTSAMWHETSSISFMAIRSRWPTLQRKFAQIHFCTHGFINYMNPPNLALEHQVSLLAPDDFCCSWAFFLFWWLDTLRSGNHCFDHLDPCLWRVFPTFSECFQVSTHRYHQRKFC